jgi:hypothetical protein
MLKMKTQFKIHFPYTFDNVFYSKCIFTKTTILFFLIYIFKFHITDYSPQTKILRRPILNELPQSVCVWHIYDASDQSSAMITSTQWLERLPKSEIFMVSCSVKVKTVFLLQVTTVFVLISRESRINDVWKQPQCPYYEWIWEHKNNARNIALISRHNVFMLCTDTDVSCSLFWIRPHTSDNEWWLDSARD